MSSRRGVKRTARSPARGKKKRNKSNRNGTVSTLANFKCRNNCTLNCVDEAEEGERDGINLLAKCFESRSQIGVSARVESHNSAVAETEKAVKEIQEEIFTSVFDSIVNFVSTAAAQAGPLIPTAVLLTGVSEICLCE